MIVVTDEIFKNLVLRALRLIIWMLWKEKKDSVRPAWLDGDLDMAITLTGGIRKLRE